MMKTLHRLCRSYRILFAAHVTVAGALSVPVLATDGTLLPRDHAYLQVDFEAADALLAWKGEGRREPGYRGGRALAIECQAGGTASAYLVSVELPVEAMRGYLVRGSAMVRAENVSSKPKPWNGIKCMLALETRERKLWPQADIDTGTFDWRRVAFTVRVPTNATSVTLVLGLEQVSGKAWFDDVKVVAAKPPMSRDTKPGVGGTGGPGDPGHRPATDNHR